MKFSRLVKEAHVVFRIRPSKNIRVFVVDVVALDQQHEQFANFLLNTLFF